MNYNRAILVGRVGRAPELRATPQGIPVAHFSLATTETWKDKATGERKERTEWHRVVAFNKLASFVGNYITQGRLLLIEGRIQSRDWMDKNNQKRTTVEIRADQILFMESKAKTVGATEVAEVDVPPEDVTGGPSDDDVPF